jgi:hypothetical protein
MKGCTLERNLMNVSSVGKPSGIYFKIRERIHRGEKFYECAECGKAFLSYIGLRGHMIVYNGDGPCKCKYCEKVFAFPSDVVKHESIHTVENL